MIIDVLTWCDWYLLQDKLDVEKDITDWLKTLPTFLDCRSSDKIQIAAICSDENVLSYSELQGMCKVSADAEFIDLSCLTGDKEIYATSICILVKKVAANNHEDALKALLVEISEALSTIGERLMAKSGNEEAIRFAKNGFKEAGEEIGKTPRYLESNLAEPRRAKDLSSYLTIGVWDGDQGNLDGFPTVRMLFFLPEAAYDVLQKYAETEKLVTPAGPKYYFFRQIVAVAHDEDQKYTMLKIDLSNQKKETEDVKVELETTKTELAATKTELAATKTELAATKTELAATKTELAATKTSLEKAESEIADLRPMSADKKNNMQNINGEYERSSSDDDDGFFR